MTVTVNATGTATNTSGAAGVINYTGITVAAGATALLAMVCFLSGAPTGLALNWDSTGTPQAMSIIGSAVVSPGSTDRCYLYGRINPTVGNRTLAVTWTGTITVAVCAISFAGTTGATVAAVFTNFAPNSGSTIPGSLAGSGAADGINVAFSQTNPNNNNGITTTGSTQIFLSNAACGAAASRVASASGGITWTVAAAAQGDWAACCVDVIVGTVPLQGSGEVDATGAITPTGRQIMIASTMRG